jgi:hypothetical protein
MPDHERLLGGSVVDPLWTIHDVSAYLAVPVGTLYQWRHRGRVLRLFASDDTCATTAAVVGSSPAGPTSITAGQRPIRALQSSVAEGPQDLCK